MSHTISRRTMLKTSCAAGALMMTRAGADLFAQAQPQFVPLRLNAQGQQLVNQRVSALDAREDALLDDMLGGGNQQQLHQDVGNLDQSLNDILADPGAPDGFDPNQFNQNGVQVHNQLAGFIPFGVNLGWTQITVVVRQVDSFVGHWYPCNDILEIGGCQQKIWGSFNGGNFQKIEIYLMHMQYEMDYMFRFHPQGGQFGQHCNALMQRVQGCRNLARNNPQACYTEFQTITSATSLVFRKYYPQYC